MIRGAVSAVEVGNLIPAIEEGLTNVSTQAHRGRAGLRNLLEIVPAARRLAAGRPIRDLVEPILGACAFAVRGILFDKTADANWLLRWHQDKAIPVKARHDVPGFGPWSVKAGVPHVYPPARVLEGMLTVRLHLDPCDAARGALQVLPGSHRFGLLDRETLKRLLAEREAIVCDAEAGDVLLMRPLLAHASGKRELPGHRRIVHLEFASEPLPAPLEWGEQVTE